jgi:hypothetical protein
VALLYCTVLGTCTFLPFQNPKTGKPFTTPFLWQPTMQCTLWTYACNIEECGYNVRKKVCPAECIYINYIFKVPIINNGVWIKVFLPNILRHAPFFKVKNLWIIFNSARASRDYWSKCLQGIKMFLFFAFYDCTWGMRC